MVKKKSGKTNLDGKNLMLTVFSRDKPILKFNNLNTISEKNEQEGFMHLFAGAVQGIRNPKAHDEMRRQLVSGLYEGLSGVIYGEETPTEQQLAEGQSDESMQYPMAKDGEIYTRAQILEMGTRTFCNFPDSLLSLLSRNIRISV